MSPCQKRSSIYYLEWGIPTFPRNSCNVTHLRSFVAVLDQADGRPVKLNNVEQQRQTTVEFIAEDEEVRVLYFV